MKSIQKKAQAKYEIFFNRACRTGFIKEGYLPNDVLIPMLKLGSFAKESTELITYWSEYSKANEGKLTALQSKESINRYYSL